MSAYLIATYDVTDPERYAQYNPGSLGVIMETIAKHDGKVLAAGGPVHWYAGERSALVILEFPNTDAAKAWEDDPDYAKVKEHRLASTNNRVEMITDEFKMPG